MQNNLTHRGGVPLPLRRLMAQPFLEYAARLALASPFFISGIVKLTDFAGASAEVSGLGLQPAASIAAAVILVQLGGSALFMTRRFCWLGAGMLAVFTVFATLLAHPFWHFPDAERGHQAATFFEHVAIIGGFAVAAILAHRACDT
ncbi:DoxX family protein [Undibacterium arcticum]|uniref:DoxX family protein n=1 Tax=Undibacterium arcticum TaxID=1762892 RepID=A0ABV7EWT7_9BURK